MVLEKIQKENDIKKLTPQELALLKDEIRQFLIESISVTGGHLASNLGDRKSTRLISSHITITYAVY